MTESRTSNACHAVGRSLIGDGFGNGNGSKIVNCTCKCGVIRCGIIIYVRFLVKINSIQI